VSRAAALVAVTAIWGWTFVVVKGAIGSYAIVPFLALRFGLAAIVLAPFSLRITRETVRAGAAIGLFLAAGYLFQTLGLASTRASDAGLVTGSFVILTPLLDRVVFGVRPARAAIIGVVLAAFGLLFLVVGQPLEIGVGDLVVAVGALAFAAQIVALSRVAARHDPIALTTVQVVVAFVAFALLWAATRQALAAPTGDVVAAIAITGVLATSVAFFVQTWAQRRLSATPTAIVLATEPAWATLFGIALAGDAFPPLRAVGAVLLLGAPLVAIVAGTQRAR
jgi:drug/metabolite transporter (DMT)-like permease